MKMMKSLNGVKLKLEVTKRTSMYRFCSGEVSNCALSREQENRKLFFFPDCINHKDWESSRECNLTPVRGFGSFPCSKSDQTTICSWNLWKIGHEIVSTLWFHLPAVNSRNECVYSRQSPLHDGTAQYIVSLIFYNHSWGVWKSDSPPSVSPGFCSWWLNKPWDSVEDLFPDTVALLVVKTPNVLAFQYRSVIVSLKGSSVVQFFHD